MNIFDAIILGIIEGFTEFLPISSTAHITLAGELLGISEADFLKTFIIAIQLGAIIPVAFFYFKKYRSDLNVHTRVAAAFLPTAIIGFALYTIIKDVFIGNIPLLLWTLGIGGVLLIVFEYFYKRKNALDLQKSHQANEDFLIVDARIDKENGLDNSTVSEITQEISHKKAFVIGCCQALAVVPGVSRSAATIVGGLALGIRRITIIEFSFILAVPTMVAATGYDILKNLELFNSETIGLLGAGFITSLIFAQLSITMLLAFIKKYNFTPFGIYRVIAALLFFFILF